MMRILTLQPDQIITQLKITLYYIQYNNNNNGTHSLDLELGPWDACCEYLETIVPFHNDISPSGEQPKHHVWAHEL